MNGSSGSNDRAILLTDKFDSENPEFLGVRIAQLMATITERDLDDLDPLYYSVDTDALENLMAGDSSIEVKFDYEGYEIVIRNDNTIEILDLSD